MKLTRRMMRYTARQISEKLVCLCIVRQKKKKINKIKKKKKEYKINKWNSLTTAIKQSQTNLQKHPSE